MNLCFIRPYPARWMFGFHKFCSRIFSHLSSYILHHAPSLIFPLTYSVTHPEVFPLAYSVRHILSGILYYISSITYSLLHTPSDIFYLIYSISHLPFAFHIYISHFRFAFAFCICILHQTIHVSHFISLFRICLLHTESCRTATLSSWLQLPCKVLEADCLSFRTR